MVTTKEDEMTKRYEALVVGGECTEIDSRAVATIEEGRRWAERTARAMIARGRMGARWEVIRIADETVVETGLVA